MQTEPVRWAVYIAALLTVGGGVLVDLSQGIPWMQSVGKALIQFAVLTVGAEVARARVTPTEITAPPGKVYRRSDGGVIDLRTIALALFIAVCVVALVYFVNVSVDVRGG